MPTKRIIPPTLLFLVLLTGCGPTVSALQEAGFRDVNVHTSYGDGTTMRLQLGGVPPAQSNAAIERAQRIVWTKTEGKFDTLSVEVSRGTWDSGNSGSTEHSPMPSEIHSRTTSYAELAKRFGPRNPKLDGS